MNEIRKRSYLAKSFDEASEFAKQIAAMNRDNKVVKVEDTEYFVVHFESTKEECQKALDWMEIYNLDIDFTYSLDDYEYDDYDYDDYDWDSYYDNTYSNHFSVLEGGYDEPTEDEWERSGLL